MFQQSEELLRALPQNIEAERFILGAVLADSDANFLNIAYLTPSDFAAEAHRRIYAAIGSVYERREHVDRLTVAHELMRFSQLESVGGLTYLISLDDRLPQMYNLDSYARIISDCAVRRTFMTAAQAAIESVWANDGSAETVAEQIALLSGLSNATGKTSLKSIPEIVGSYGGMHAFFARSDTNGLIETTIRELDTTLSGGFRGGQLITLAARPGVGKSVLASQIAVNAARQGKGVAFFSFEMSDKELIQRAVSAQVSVPLQSIITGAFTGNQHSIAGRGLGSIWPLPLKISDRGRTTPSALVSEVRRLQSEFPVALVVVDHLHLMASGGTYSKRVDEISYLTRSLKIAAKELDVAILELSQLSRGGEAERRRPVLSDLRDSGSIEQDSDIVIFLHHDKAENQREWIVAKQRNGPLGGSPVHFDSQYVRFTD